jgi:hypothetical protein
MSYSFRTFVPAFCNSHDFVRPKNEAERLYFESLVRDDYDRAHPEDSFDDMKRRRSFSPEDQGLYRDWLAVAAVRAFAGPIVFAPVE